MKRISLLLALMLCVLVAPAAKAQSNLGLKKLGVALGFVSPQDIDMTFSFGALADWGMITPRVGLESRLDYWGHTDHQFGVEASIHDVTLGARGKYFFDVAKSNMHPFAGAGLGIHFLSGKVHTAAFGGFPAMDASSSDTKLGLDLGGGFKSSVGPRTDFLGEAWYGIVSDVSQFSLRAGLSYKIGM
jgi:hypothetical protein